jgi:hypothetical protein
MNTDYDGIARRLYANIAPSPGEEACDAIKQALLTAYNSGMERSADICSARYMGDNTREDMEARRCAAAILAERQK